MRGKRFGALTGIPALAALVVCLCAPAVALDPERSVGQYLHGVWQTADGLPDNYVTSIVQTCLVRPR